MPESLAMWVEVVFDILYLIGIWILVVLMSRRLGATTAKNRRTAKLSLIAFLLLAIGDTGHVGFRVLTYALGNASAQFSILGIPFGWLGLGMLMSAITVTLFYVVMVAMWRARFETSYGPFEYVLFAAALIRLVLLALPANEWFAAVPPQPWGTIRNIPLLVQGLGVVYLFLRDGRSVNDRPFIWMGLAILVSYACYVPVILFVQQVPLIGMLMMPKTLAYVAAALVAYNALFKQPADQA